MKRRDFFGALGTSVAGAIVSTLLPQHMYRVGAHPTPPTTERLFASFVERWSWAMGQPVHLQLFAESVRHGYDAAAAALAELRRVESRLTLFDDASDLAELNRCAGKRGCRVGSDLSDVLLAALRIE